MPGNSSRTVRLMYKGAEGSVVLGRRYLLATSGIVQLGLLGHCEWPRLVGCEICASPTMNGYKQI